MRECAHTSTDTHSLLKFEGVLHGTRIHAYAQTYAVPDFRVRRGPVIDDQTRMTETIPYERTQFAYPMSLVSPPILLQTRVEKTKVCRNHLGSIYQDKIWADTTNGGESGEAGARETKRERHCQRERDTVRWIMLHL